MNFEQLRSIIKNIKTQIRCPHCDSNFMNEDIHVVNCSTDKCMMLIQCHDCRSSLMITASLRNKGITHHSKEDVSKFLNNNPKIKEKADNTEEVVVDDVLNIHEFLKDFSGDFSTIFDDSKATDK